MGKLSFLLRRLRYMHYDKFFATAKQLHEKTGKPTLFLLCDMANCAVKYGAGYVDYRIAEMYKLSASQRKTVITRGISNKIVAEMNPKEYWHHFDNKTEFNALFAEHVKREWFDLSTGTKEAFVEWLNGKEVLVAKPLDGSSGRGVKKIRPENYRNDPDFYEKLKADGTGIIEECVIQHDAINEINPSSVNTIRIVTLNGPKKNGIVYACIRIGQNGTDMDNVDCGGMACRIDLESGMISTDGADKQGNVYENHPESGVKLKGFTIPYFEDAKNMCIESAKKVPQMRYIAWDVAITPDGPVFIEGNSFPSHAVPQFSAFYPDGIGIMPRYREFIDV
ncbi:MAG: hypothetical protein J6D42_05450 [Clostridia bacterium]|nr:hypothetical protein [Clostridia bacterium]